MLNGYTLTEKFLRQILSDNGANFVLSKIQEQKEQGILEQAAKIHSICTGIDKKIIKEYYFNLWANWKPGNVSDLYVYVDQEIKDFCYYSGMEAYPKYKGKGLFTYLAAKNNFRCSYTNIPLLPIKPGLFNNDINLPDNIAQTYAWYPSIDHIDSTTPDDKIRHSIKNLVLTGHQINRMFGSINKDIAKNVMYSISTGGLLDDDISIKFGNESLIKSSRNK